METHKKMLDWYMKRDTYLGALMAMNAAAKFVGVLRPEDIRMRTLSDLGANNTGKIIDLNRKGESNPVVGFMCLGKHPKTQKKELAFYLPHKDDEANLFF